MKSHYILAIAVPLFINGCCDDRVDARVFVGHLSPAQCREFMNKPEAPASITCPGEEITICWAASGPDKVHIDVTDDASGSVTETFDDGAVGAVYIKPKDDATVKITAGCASTSKKVKVINGNESAEFDAHYDCQQISYSIDPLFVSPSVMAIDATAKWTPMYQVYYPDGSSEWKACGTPPFLSGWHPQNNFGFSIDNPFQTKAFSTARPLVGDWQYVLKAQCGEGERICNPNGQFPFAMTLMCKQ